MNKTINGRLEFVDIARGIAMICIVLGHLGIADINKIVFTFHVPIFFLLSGYFINTNSSIKSFTMKKFRTLIIPYIVTCIAIIILAVLKSILLHEGSTKQVAVDWIFASFYGAGGTFTKPFLIKGIGAIWFLLASFWASVLLRLLLECKAIIRILSVICIFSLSVWSAPLAWLPFSIQAGGCALGFMYLGYLFKQNKNKFSRFSVELKFVSVVTAIAIWFSFINNFQSFWLVQCDIGRGVIDILGCICACFIIFIISYCIQLKLPIIAAMLSYLGRYSIFMLCVHITELNLFPWYFLTDYITKIGLSNNSALLVLIIGKLLLVISFTMLLSKCKFTRTLFGLKQDH